MVIFLLLIVGLTNSVPDCYVPIPAQFSAVYNDSAGILLNWDTEHREPGIRDCDSILVTVQGFSYSNYNSFASGNVDPFAQALIASPNGSKFQLGINDVQLSNYYVFDVNVVYNDKFGGMQRTSINSPLFFFGTQGTCSVPMKLW